MRQEELKQDQERIKRVPLPTPQSQASSIPLFEQEGSAICDRLYELFSKGRVSPCQDSTSVTNGPIHHKCVVKPFILNDVRSFSLLIPNED